MRIIINNFFFVSKIESILNFQNEWDFYLSMMIVHGCLFCNSRLAKEKRNNIGVVVVKLNRVKKYFVLLNYKTQLDEFKFRFIC